MTDFRSSGGVLYFVVFCASHLCRMCLFSDLFCVLSLCGLLSHRCYYDATPGSEFDSILRKHLLNLRTAGKYTRDILKVGNLTQFITSQLTNRIPSFMLAITSICISRVMLGIRSLAAELVSDPALVLNNAELSRVCWKKGPNAGELIVDVDDYSFGVLDIRQEIDRDLDMESDKDSGTTDQVSRIGSPV
jgi:hypothetical protein